MNYKKPPISIVEQIAKLKRRGLIFDDEQKAISCLSNISYYRFRAYTYPFQDNTDDPHLFTSKISFEDILGLYVFDKKLRMFVLGAIEKIEISFRTQIIYNWAMAYGSHWHLDASLFRNSVQFARNYNKLHQEIDRSVETFIKHYKHKYTDPAEPPSWMSLEVTSFGLLSLIFSNLKLGKEKKNVTKHYGLNDVGILENWMHSLSNIRNICAHHGRLWNRRFTTLIKLPTNPDYSFLNNDRILPYKIYAALCCMQYVLNIISPGSNFKQKLIELMNNCPLAQEKEMGFPADWQKEPLWK